MQIDTIVRMKIWALYFIKWVMNKPTQFFKKLHRGFFIIFSITKQNASNEMQIFIDKQLIEQFQGSNQPSYWWWWLWVWMMQSKEIVKQN